MHATLRAQSDGDEGAGLRVYLLTAVVARRLVHLSAACHAALHLKARTPDDIICLSRGPHTGSFGRRGLAAPLCSAFLALAALEVAECLPFGFVSVVCLQKENGNVFKTGVLCCHKMWT